MVISESDVPGLVGVMLGIFASGWASHKFLRKDKKSKKELGLIAEFIVKSGVFSNWKDIFEKKPELAKFMLDNPKIMDTIDELSRRKADG